MHYSRKLRQYEKAEKLEAKADRANIDAMAEKAKTEDPVSSTNPISRWRQKQAIKQEYAAAKAGRCAGTAAGSSTAAGGARRAEGAEHPMEESMRPANAAITPEGYPVIFLTSLCALASALLGSAALTVIFLVLVWFSLNFFRDPERVVPQEAGAATSPADGKVVKIERRVDPMTGEERTCICIFMNIFNVHVNRTPVAGTVEQITYWPGKFFNASLDKASVFNERCGYAVKSDEGPVFSFVQIAGLVARRIVCRAELGDRVARGERIGMIRFGSRVDLYLPAGYTPAVTLGREVLAGQTIVARRGAAS
jgi:phosphatidylserine decarboxylase